MTSIADSTSTSNEMTVTSRRSAVSGASRGEAIFLEQASVTYRSKRSGELTVALAATDVTFDAGSFTALLGPTGCGKTTLLNAVAGFVELTSGSVRIGDRRITKPGPDRAVVLQQYALMPWMTALANVEMALERFQLSRSERATRARNFLDSVGLGGATRKYPGEMSGGMQQRVALARSMAAEPSALLMDEPFGALDAITRIAMQRLLMQLWSQTTTTVLFVTHDVNEALDLAERILLMSPGPGRIVADLNLSTSDLRTNALERERIYQEILGYLLPA